MILLLFILMNCFSFAYGETGKTFFMPRQITQDAVLEHAGLDHFLWDNEPSKRFSLSASVFYQESTNDKDLARFFFPNNKTELSIKGATAVGIPDVSATWLQIAGINTISPNPGGGGFPFAGSGDAALYLNEFQSIVSIRPEMKNFGTILQVNKTLDRISDRLWLSLMVPIMQVQTDTKLREFDIQKAVPSRADIGQFIVVNNTNEVQRQEVASLAQSLSAAEGLNNRFWQYGKIKSGCQKIAGIADIKIKLGYDPIDTSSIKLQLYPTLTIPMGYKSRAEYMFEPMLGNGRHFAFGAGGNFDIKLINDCQQYLSLGTSLEYNYLFEGTERRSFDVGPNGQWSRYMLVFQPNSDEFTPKPGINFLTKPLNVVPQSEINWLTSMRYNRHNFFIESGYNLWWKDKEKVSLKHAWDEQIAFAHQAFGIGDAATPFNGFPFAIQSASQAKVSQHTNIAQGTGGAAGDLVTTLIQASDLDLKSAAMPSRMTHKIFLTTGLNGTWDCKPVSIAVGGAYEFAQNNAALEQWSVWLKCNLSL